MSDGARLVWCIGLAFGIFALSALSDPRPEVGVGFLHAVPIGLAAWWFGPWAAAAFVGLSLALVLVVFAIHPLEEEGLALAVRLAVFTGVALVVSLLRERTRELQHSAEELEAIRDALTPPVLPELTGVEAAATFVPSEHGVSGDFYLVTNGPDNSTIAMVGDVEGHGPGAARLATFVRARLAALAASTSDPGEILSLANDAVVEQKGRRRALVSAACVRIDVRRGVISWALAGHPPPRCLPSLEPLEPPNETALLGIEGDLVVSTRETSLADNEGVLVYTDGATDVQRGRARLGIEGLVEMLRPHVQLPASELVGELQRSLLDWADRPIRDDLCILALRPKDRVRETPAIRLG